MADRIDGNPPTVLVVEDEFIIALDLTETVQDLGYAIDGPYADRETALQAISQSLPDCAILDVNIRDGLVYPLADVLAERGVPIIFHTSQAEPQEMKARYPRALACPKPYRLNALAETLQCALGLQQQSASTDRSAA